MTGWVSGITEKTIHNQENILLSSRSMLCFFYPASPHSACIYMYILCDLHQQGKLPTIPKQGQGGDSDRVHVNNNWKYPRVCITQRAWQRVLFVILAFSWFSSCIYVIMLPFLLKGVSWYGTFCASFSVPAGTLGWTLMGFTLGADTSSTPWLTQQPGEASGVLGRWPCPLGGLEQLDQVAMPGMEKTQRGKEWNDQSTSKRRGECFMKHTQAVIFKDFS